MRSVQRIPRSTEASTRRVAAWAVAENFIFGTMIEYWQAGQAPRKRFHPRNLVGCMNTTLLSPQFRPQRMDHGR